MVLGQLVGVLAVESRRAVAFDADDEALLDVVATLVASAIEIDGPRSAPSRRRRRRAGDAGTRAGRRPRSATTHVRFFAVDGSTFLDGDYLIKGVAGRILWVLLDQHARDGRDEFTNKEVRLDPSLELPEFRDNLESRLILLKRRLDERARADPHREDGTGPLPPHRRELDSSSRPA